MKRFAKIALGAVMLAGAATAIASPASAGIAVGFGVGPGYYGPPAGAVCDPYSRFYNPYYCGPVGYGYDYGPVIGFGGFTVAGAAVDSTAVAAFTVVAGSAAATAAVDAEVTTSTTSSTLTTRLRIKPGPLS